jgi:hypothetical protein
VSQRDEKPTPLAYVSIKSGIFYLDGFLIGADLGTDALGRGIGSIEADATVGMTPKLDKLQLNVGAKYTSYPNGRDVIVGSLETAERDFIEPFAIATVSLSDKATIGGGVYWTPDFFYETGEVVTLEGQMGLVLPPAGTWNSKMTAYAGVVHSDNQNVVCPGDGYTYYNVGLEAQIERMLFDIRFWNTDVEGYEAFEKRLVLSAGVSF